MSSRNDSIDNFRFFLGGREFRADVYADEGALAPWKQCDGHGPVSDWTLRDKRAGEWILAKDGNYRRIYDAQEAQRRALLDCWQLSPAELAALHKREGGAVSQRMIAARAVRLDFERLRAWCRDEWFYVGVCVRALDASGSPIGERYACALWGIESDDADYIRCVADELADEVPSIRAHYADEARALAARMQANATQSAALADAAQSLQRIAGELGGQS